MEHLLLGANVSFFTIFSKLLHFKGVQRHLCGVMGQGKPLGIVGKTCIKLFVQVVSLNEIFFYFSLWYIIAIFFSRAE